MKKVLMVCLGNICRSPMAEGLFQKKIDHYALNAEVDSAGTSNYHIGEAPDHRAVDTMHQNGIDISQLAARQFTAKDFDRFDLILAMDESNRDNILSLARSEEDRKKVKLMLEYLTDPDAPLNVPDPYFGERDGFAYVFDLLDNATDQLAKELAS
jgi:protein-tyrosine phosphatase